MVQHSAPYVQFLFTSLICIWTVSVTYGQENQIEFLHAMRNCWKDGHDQLINEPSNTRDVDLFYDFIIVGAGSAGCVLAARLSEIPTIKVLLIEAGGPEEFYMDIPMNAVRLQNSHADWSYYSEPNEGACLAMFDNRCYYPRGKVMGGSSVLNFMIYSRGHSKDYDHWAEAGCHGWSYREVRHYFKKAENFLIDEYYNPDENGKGGPLHVEYSPYLSPVAKLILAGFNEKHYHYSNINDAENLGVSRIPATLKAGTRHSTSRAYLHPIHHRKNLHVKKNSQVLKVLIDETTKKAYGVEFMENYQRKRKVYCRKEVILSAGAMNSPQLLMLSGIGPRDHLEEVGIPLVHHSLVGYNLQDHIANGGLLFVVTGTKTTTPLDLIRNQSITEEYCNHHTGPLSVPGGCELIALTDPDDEGIPTLELLIVSQQVALNFFLNTPLAAFIEPYMATGIWVALPMVMKPYSHGRIKLKSNDPFDNPLIYPNYFADERDLATMVKGARRMLEINKSKIMRSRGSDLIKIPLPACALFPEESDEYLECLSRQLTFNIYHQSGTCKMGPRENPTSVVDPRLRVIGVENLRVIDVSILPEIPSSHTNAPTVMVAEKGADMIKEDWGLPIPFDVNWAYRPEHFSQMGREL